MSQPQAGFVYVIMMAMGEGKEKQQLIWMRGVCRHSDILLSISQVFHNKTRRTLGSNFQPLVNYQLDFLEVYTPTPH